MNLKYDGPLSNFAFNCNLRPSTTADDGVQFQAPFNIISAALNSVLKFVGRKDAEQVTMSFANADVSVPASATTSASASASQQQVSADDVDDTSSAATAAAAAAADIIIPKGFSFGVKRKPGAGTTALVSFMNLMLRALVGSTGCKLNPGLESVWFQRLKLKCDELLSNFGALQVGVVQVESGLTARLVATLEAEMR